MNILDDPNEPPFPKKDPEPKLPVPPGPEPDSPGPDVFPTELPGDPLPA